MAKFVDKWYLYVKKEVLRWSRRRRTSARRSIQRAAAQSTATPSARPAAAQPTRLQQLLQQLAEPAPELADTAPVGWARSLVKAARAEFLGEDADMDSGRSSRPSSSRACSC